MQKKATRAGTAEKEKSPAEAAALLLLAEKFDSIWPQEGGT